MSNVRPKQRIHLLDCFQTKFSNIITHILINIGWVTAKESRIAFRDGHLKFMTVKSLKERKRWQFFNLSYQITSLIIALVFKIYKEDKI